MSTIKSGNTETTGLAYQSDTTGNLVFETMGVTAVTIDNNQNVAMAGNLTVSGNIAGDYILGNGSQLTGLPESYSNANVAAYLPTYTGNLASLSGNVTTTATVSATTLTGTLSTAAQPNITSVGTLSSLNVTGNISGGNVSATALTGTLSTAAQPNITSVGTLGALSASGNITGGNIATAGQYRQGGSAMMSVVQIGPAATNIAYTGTINAQYTLNPDTVPAGARYIFCDIFITATISDHQNFMFSRSNMGSQKNWVDTRGANPAGQFGNLTSQENTILTYFGENDGFSSNYGIWYPSQFLPTVGRTVWMNNFGNSGSNGYVYIIVKGYSM